MDGWMDAYDGQTSRQAARYEGRLLCVLLIFFFGAIIYQVLYSTVLLRVRGVYPGGVARSLPPVNTRILFVRLFCVAVMRSFFNLCDACTE